MRQWGFYGMVAPEVYLKIFRTDRDKCRFAASRKGNYRTVMVGSLLPKVTHQEVEAGPEKDPVELNKKIREILVRVYGGGWKALLDTAMPADEFKKENSRFSLMPHAEYYLSQAREACKNKKDVLAVNELIKQAGEYESRDKDPVIEALNDTHDKQKQKDAYLQLVRTGATKRVVKGRCGGFFIGYILHDVIIEGVPAWTSLLNRCEEYSVEVPDARKEIKKALVSGIDDRDYGIRFECKGALEEHSDNYTEKIKGLASIAGVKEKKLKKAINRSTHEFCKWGRFQYKHTPVFYSDAIEKLYTSDLKAFHHGFVKRAKTKYKYAKPKKIVFIPQADNFGKRLLKRLIRILLIPLSIIIAVYWVINDYITFFSKEKDIAGICAAVCFFCWLLIKNPARWIGCILVCLPAVVIFAYRFLESMFKEAFIIPVPISGDRVDKRIRAALFGVDPGIPQYTFDDVRKGIVPYSTPIIVSGEVMVRDVLQQIPETRQIKLVTHFSSFNVYDPVTKEGIIHVITYDLSWHKLPAIRYLTGKQRVTVIGTLEYNTNWKSGDWESFIVPKGNHHNGHSVYFGDISERRLRRFQKRHRITNSRETK